MFFSIEDVNKIESITPISTWIWDLKSDEVWWSDKMYNILGQEKYQEINKKSFFEYLHEEDRAEYKIKLLRTINEYVDFSHSGRIIKSDGSIVRVFFKGTAVVDIDGVLIKFIGTMQETCQDLVIEQFSKMMTTLSSHLSHEVRSPIRTIGSMTGLIKLKSKEELSSECQYYFSLIEHAAQELSHTIDDLLTLTQVD